MNWHNIMRGFAVAFAVLFAAVGVLDPFAAANDIAGDTFTEVFMDAAATAWVLPWALGALCAHLCIHRAEDVPGFWLRFAVLCVIAAILVVANIATALHGMLAPYQVPGIMFGAGVVAGGVLWPMKGKRNG